MNNIEFKNLHWDYSWNSEGVQEDIEFKLGKIANEMAKQYTTSCVVVVIKNCDIHGAYETMDIHVFANFVDANNLLNSEMYEPNHALDIYHYNCMNDEFTPVMYKCHDGFNFSRLAGIDKQKMFDDQLVFRMRKVFDMKSTNVTIHPMKL